MVVVAVVVELLFPGALPPASVGVGGYHYVPLFISIIIAILGLPLASETAGVFFPESARSSRCKRFVRPAAWDS